MSNEIIDPKLHDESILFARFAAAAYLDSSAQAESGLEKLRNELRLNEGNSFNNTETQALLCRWNDDIVIAFRGTEQTKLGDWWTDLSGHLTSNFSGKGRIHSGFKAAAESVYSPIVRYIKNNSVPNSRLFVCGHSLGGALALLTANRFADDPALPIVRKVFTYGAPRVGDLDFAEAYRAAKMGSVTHMWVAARDPVPRVAPHSLGHRHAVIKQFTLDQGSIGLTELDSKLEIEQEQDWLAQLPIVAGIVGVFGSLQNAFRTLQLAEHSVTGSYLRQLLSGRGSVSSERAA